jgi:hypothetical protein
MLGYEPTLENMVIATGQDFSHYFGVTEDDPFPDDTVLTLKIYARDAVDQIGSWPAILVEEGGAQVQIASTDLDIVPDGATFRVYVTYPDSQALCWYRGRVWRRDK